MKNKKTIFLSGILIIIIFFILDSYPVYADCVFTDCGYGVKCKSDDICNCWTYCSYECTDARTLRVRCARYIYKFITTCARRNVDGYVDCGSDSFDGYVCKYESSWGGWSVFQKWTRRGCSGSSCYSYENFVGVRRCGTSYCGDWTCSGDTRIRTCYDKGCSDGSCYENSYTDYGGDCGGDYCEGWNVNCGGWYRCGCDGNYIKECRDCNKWRTCHDRGCSGGSCYDNTYEDDGGSWTETRRSTDCGGDYWTNNYRCSGQYKQREYISRGCSGSSCYSSSEWKTVEDCGSGGYWTDEYRCSGNMRQRKWIGQGCLDGNCYTGEEWKDYEDCGSNYCESWSSNYCKNGDVYHKRICHNKGCSGSSCYDNTYTDEQLVEDCAYGCSDGVCYECSPATIGECGDCGEKTCQSNGKWASCSKKTSKCSQVKNQCGVFTGDCSLENNNYNCNYYTDSNKCDNDSMCGSDYNCQALISSSCCYNYTECLNQVEISKSQPGREPSDPAQCIPHTLWEDTKCIP